jgi:hypothetical protein
MIEEMHLRLIATDRERNKSPFGDAAVEGSGRIFKVGP